MNIQIYARSPNQEFSVPIGPSSGVHWKWSKGPNLSPTNSRSGSESPLNSVLALRRDHPDYGFVHNCQNDLVFYADAEAFELIERYLRKPMRVVEEQAQWILDALHISRIKVGTSE